MSVQNGLVVFPLCVLLSYARSLYFAMHRFDIRRAYRPSVFQKLKDVFGVGGHVYGYGAYFAAEALYSHWWNTRIWNSKKAAKSVAVVLLHIPIVHSVSSVCWGQHRTNSLRISPTEKCLAASRNTNSSWLTSSLEIAKTMAANGLTRCKCVTTSNNILSIFF